MPFIKRFVWLIFAALFILPSPAMALNALPQGLDYPFANKADWQIINGYNDGLIHGSVVKGYDYFYAYYAFDFTRKSGHGTTAGSTVSLPSDAYYYRAQASSPGELCIDFSIGSFSPNFDMYLEMCHVDFFPSFLQNKGTVQNQFLPKGTILGTIANENGCGNCNPPHVHVAAYLAPPGAPWPTCGGTPNGWCRFPFAFEAYANFSLAFSGDSYPPKETQLFQVQNQWDATPLDNGGGGSNEGNQSGQTGNSHVDIFENTNYGGEQYGWDDPTNGWVNGPGSLNDKVSSIQIDDGYSLYVAKDQYGGGTHKCFTRSYTDLSGAYWDDGSPMTDTISSINAFHDYSCGGNYFGTEPGDTVTIWTNNGYHGDKYGWHEPNMENLTGGWGNSVTAVAISPGWSALVYESQDGLNGQICLYGSDPDLSDNGFMNGNPLNDNIESIRIFHDANCNAWIPSTPTPSVPNPVVSFFTDASSGGVPLYYSVVGAFNLTGAHVNSLSSVSVTAGWSVVVYQNPSGQGGAACFVASDPDLSNNSFDNGQLVNDNIESVWVVDNTNCSGWTPATATSMPTATPVPNNLVANGNMESLDGNGWASGWIKTDGSITLTQSGGNHSVSFGVNGSQSNAKLLSAPFAVSSLYVYQWTVSVTSTSGSGEFGFYIDEYDSSMAYVGGQWLGSISPNTNGTTTFSFVPTDARSAFASLQYYMTPGNSMTVMLDNVSVLLTGVSGTPGPTNTPVATASHTPTLTLTPTVTLTSTPVPPSNLVTNGGFESLTNGWANGWSNVSPSFVSIDTGVNGNEGTNSVHFAPNTDSQNTKVLSPPVNVSFGTNYTWTFYVKATNGSGEFGFYIDEYDSSGFEISGQWKDGIYEATNGGKQYSYTPTSSSVAYVTFQYYLIPGSSFDVYVDSVSVTQN